MWPDQVSNPGPLIYESVALPVALRGPAPVPVTGLVYVILEYGSTAYRNMLAMSESSLRPLKE